MNILIPHQWLLEHLKTDQSPEELQKKVSLSGPSVERIYQKVGDSVYDIEVTTNRVDSMSVRGVAREAAVILQQFGHPAKLKTLELHRPAAPLANAALPLPKITNNPEFCKRIMCVVLSSVQHTATPDWMAKRLQQIESNIHDAVIDITNYITHELGHPCHAFDYDQIMKLGGEIIVTQATAGESFTTLDGETYQTVGGEIVFKNPAGEIIDLPAIKGTANSAITDQTKNVLFWIESLDAKKVRFASMTHAIRTVAAQLNEKNVDPNLADEVLLRGIELYQELCSATVASEIYDEFHHKITPEPVRIAIETITEYLGLAVPVKEIEAILASLGCSVEVVEDTSAKIHLNVTPPTFRPDITIPADVVEEIARIYGYHKLPSVLMDTPIPLDKPTDTDYTIESKIKHFLAAIGWYEVYTYSLVSEEIAQQSGFSLDEHLKLQNPLTDDRVYLRRSLLPSLEEVIDTNQEPTASVFELALTYTPQEATLPKQIQHLSLVSGKSFSQAKGDLEALLQQFFIVPSFLVVETTTKQHTNRFTQLADIMVQDEKIGEIGVLKSGKTAATITIPKLLVVAKKHPTYQPKAKTSYITEDLTFTLPAQTAVGEVVSRMKEVASVITGVEVKDHYQQNVTFRITYQNLEENLTSEAVAPVRSSLVKTIENEYQAQLVGSLE